MNTEVLVPGADKELRETNMAIIREYLAHDSHKKKEIFDGIGEEFYGGLYTTVNRKPAKFPTGKGECKLDALDFNNRIFKLYPDWTNDELTIYQTADPSVYVVTNRGYGNVLAPKYGYPYYEMYFFHYFEVKDGKVTKYFENINPCSLLVQFGAPPPVINRPARKRDYLENGRLGLFEDRLSSLLYKHSVELDMVMGILADSYELTGEDMRRCRADSVCNVKQTNGRLSFEQKVQALDEAEDEWLD